MSNHGEIINVGTLLNLDTKESMSEYSEQIWDILMMSYEPIGGLKSYRSYNDFVNKKHYANVIVGESGDILACETYRLIDGSRKIVAIGCDQTYEGKLALQQLIQNKIINAELCYWSEVSGVIEHYFKKYNGFPMPNMMASEILNIEPSKITLSRDNVHYTRPIGQDNELFEKVIYGIKNEEVFRKVMDEIENYSDFVKKANSLNESGGDNIKICIYVIENIYRAHEEDGFNELIPSWHKALVKCLMYLKKQDRTETVCVYIEYAEYLLKDMPLLELHRF